MKVLSIVALIVGLTGVANAGSGVCTKSPWGREAIAEAEASYKSTHALAMKALNEGITPIWEKALAAEIRVGKLKPADLANLHVLLIVRKADAASKPFFDQAIKTINEAHAEYMAVYQAHVGPCNSL